MKNHFDDIACQRSQLLEKIRTQKRQIADFSLQLQKPLALADAGIRAICFIRSHPTLAKVAVALLLALRRRDFTGLKQHGRKLLCLHPATAHLTRYFPSQRLDSKAER